MAGLQVGRIVTGEELSLGGMIDVCRRTGWKWERWAGGFRVLPARLRTFKTCLHIWNCACELERWEKIEIDKETCMIEWALEKAGFFYCLDSHTYP